MTLSAGVDACRGGWVAVLAKDGGFAKSILAPGFRQLLDALEEAEVIGVDIPIGLPRDGPRKADIEARTFVGRRRNSVFPTPPREAIVKRTYADARVGFPSLSAQSYAIGKKILEVEKCLEERVLEVHPEVSFRELAGSELAHSKRSWNGQMERRRLLAQAGLQLPDKLEAGEAPVDDVLDAAVAAWSANRKARGEAKTLPENPPIQDGRPVAIWY